MENEFYICEYCRKAYLPKKRGYQKYCKPSCRASAYNRRKKESKIQNKDSQVAEQTNQDPAHEETINAAGIGNAVIGTAIVEGAKHFLVHPNDRPATKGDIDRLQINLNNRYQPVINLLVNEEGKRPFYDTITKELVYLY